MISCSDLSSDFEILDISTTGASVKNDRKLKRGKKTTITIKFDDLMFLHYNRVKYGNIARRSPMELLR